MEITKAEDCYGKFLLKRFSWKLMSGKCRGDTHHDMFDYGQALLFILELDIGPGTYLHEMLTRRLVKSVISV